MASKPARYQGSYGPSSGHGLWRQIGGELGEGDGGGSGGATGGASSLIEHSKKGRSCVASLIVLIWVSLQTGFVANRASCRGLNLT